MDSLDFSVRSRAAELMDSDDVDFTEFRACLVDLARVNRWTLAYRPTLAFLDRIAQRGLPRDRPLTIVDVGSGYGDMLREISAWAARRGIAVSLTGIDRNPWARQAAAEVTAHSDPIHWLTADAFSYEPPGGIDVIVNSLLTHHLTDPLVVHFLRWMEDNARLGWFINDLHRHPLPYYFFRHAARLARYHHFVQHDGPVSIARAFQRVDWQGLLSSAGINEISASIEWWLPFRLCVERFKQPR